MRLRSMLAALLLLATLGVASPAKSDVTIWLYESGTDVLGVASGSIDISGFVNSGVEPVTGGVNPAGGILMFAPTTATDARLWFYLDGVTPFGSGGAVAATSFSGTIIGAEFRAFESVAYLEDGYVSGSPISSTMTFASQTLATLGLTRGTYVWAVDSTNPKSSRLTLQIGTAPPSAAVPVPASLLLLATGVAALAAARRRMTA